MKKRNASRVALMAFAVCAAAVAANAQVVGNRIPAHSHIFASNIIVPQSGAFRADRQRGTVRITGVEAGVVIVEQVATTEMDIALENTGYSKQEAELVVPVPDGAVVRGFTFQGAAKEPTAKILKKEEARRTYEQIVAKVRDPALLEFAGYNLIQSSVFPVESRGTQKVRLTYEQILPADGKRIDYVLPRSESLEYSVPWKVAVKIKSKTPIATAYSPSHRLETTRAGDKTLSVRIAKNAEHDPGAFRLSYLLEGDGIAASLLAYPDPSIGGGYFLLLAGVPAKAEGDGEETAIKREVTLVFDRSGSMNGEKIGQVREAALQILAGLEDEEKFNVLVYNETVTPFSDMPVFATKQNIDAARRFLSGVKSRGGTNIHDALLEALRQKPTEGMLPIVLFLTDGLPTIGQTSEVAIRNVAMKANPYQRRIFTFGVGVDVNTPLLEKIAEETRATPTFVLPKEDVEVKVSQVFKRLKGPVLADPEMKVAGGEGKPSRPRVEELMPARLPDLFEDDQLVLLGKYNGEAPITFRLGGNYRGKQRTFQFKFDLEKATTRNAFVPRLWASRKIGMLVDAIRQAGADIGQFQSQVAVLQTTPQQAGFPYDPKIQELVDEIVRLSTEFGILTEYTAFLAEQGTDLSKRGDVLAQARRNFETRAMATRHGLGSFNQSVNGIYQKNQFQLNYDNGYFDQNMNRVEITAVQQVNDRAFYKRGNRWVDSRIVNDESNVKASKVIEFGSEDFRKLASKLADEGRAGSISLRGDILMVVDEEPVLIKGPGSR